MSETYSSESGDSSENTELIRKFYAEGRPLPMILEDGCGGTCSIAARIVKLHQPSSLSCVLTVEVPGFAVGSPWSSEQAILKLFDRRFSAQLRRDEEIHEWTWAAEQAFLDFTYNGQATTFIDTLPEDDWELDEPDGGWSLAEKEAVLQDKCSRLFCTEVRAYDTLQSLQGKQIPTLHSTVSIPLHPGAPEQDVLTVNGLLLEYIPGPTLSEMPVVIPQEKWQAIVDKAVNIVRGYSHLGILNQDVRPDNFVINEAVSDEDERRVMMIDFALCKFREPWQTEAEWGRAKWLEDEAGAVGVVMRTRLKKLGYKLTYEPNCQWAEYAPGEHDKF